MKNLLLSLLFFGSVSFAEDLAYYDQVNLLTQSSLTKQVAQAVDSKLSMQESNIRLLVNKISSQEAQLKVYTDKYPSYNNMSKQQKKSFDAIYSSYAENLSTLNSRYKQFTTARNMLNRYAAARLTSMSDGVAKNYAQNHGLKVIYDAKQFRYIESSFDITTKLLPIFNELDTKDFASAEINCTKLKSLEQPSDLDF